MERAQWREAWNKHATGQVQAHPEYVRLFANGGRAMCAFWTNDRGTLLLPFVIRPVPPLLANAGEGCCDIASPYGYGGPFGVTLPEGSLREFWEEFAGWARERSVVAEFIRFSLDPARRSGYPGVIRTRQPNVVRSLNIPLAEMWMQFEHKVRKNVRKAERSHVDVVLDESGERLDDFVRVYRDTMDRREADDQYLYDRAFFEDLVKNLKGGFAFFHAMYQSAVVSTELVLVGRDDVYSFLGGTMSEYFEFRPNDLLKFRVIEWAKAAGKQRYVLGGGYRQNDGIFRYKHSFAPGGIVDFTTGERVINATKYHELVARRFDGANPADAAFFPAYRAPLHRDLAHAN